MKVLLSITLLVLLPACGNGPQPYIDETFIPEFNKFKLLAKERNVELDENRLNNLSITFADDLGKVASGAEIVGLCTISDDGYFVQINKTFWKNFGWSYQETLLFHELGHCVLGRKHINTLNPVSGIPTSMMYPELLSQLDFQLGYGYYYDELFTHLHDGN